MNAYLRDLALELYKDYGLSPEDLECKGWICYDKNDGKILSGEYGALVGYTSADVYKFETNLK